jgi:hypothetical protein
MQRALCERQQQRLKRGITGSGHGQDPFEGRKWYRLPRITLDAA